MSAALVCGPVAMRKKRQGLFRGREEGQESKGKAAVQQRVSEAVGVEKFE